MNHCVFLFLLTLIPLGDVLGQSTSLANFIECVELQNGSNNLLINGKLYFPDHLKAEGHPYFQRDEWKSGRVYINGNSYPANHLKYNLHHHQLILDHERPNGTSRKIVLSDLLVDSFHIEEQLFVNLALVLPEKEESGYLEKIYEEELSFFRLQRKVFVAPSTGNPYGRFSNLKDVFYLLMGDGQHHEITRKRNFLACFPDHKSQIKKYMKNHSLRWKKITNPQFANLLKFCHGQI